MKRIGKSSKRYSASALMIAAIAALAIIFAGLARHNYLQPSASAKPTGALNSASGSTSTDEKQRQRLNESFSKLPLYFVENKGQVDSRVAFYIQGKDKLVYFTPEGVTFSLTGGLSGGNPKLDPQTMTASQPAFYETATGELKQAEQPGAASVANARYTVKLDFVGANPNVRPVGQEQTEATFSYFTGPKEQWKSALKSYSKIVYPNLWPGIDLVYSGTVNRIKYSFIVKPGADPSRIKLAYRGADNVSINEAGELEITTPASGFKDDSPVSHQIESGETGKQREIKTAYKLIKEGKQPNATYGFELGEYDRSKELVIDPAVLVYCGYIGGSGGGADDEAASSIAVDASGNAYVAGYTNSPQSSFPVTAGPDLTINGSVDAYVAKINAAGTALVYCSYIGGIGTDRGYGVAVDGGGNAYVSGLTGSSQTTFPVIGGPDLTFNSGTDVFVAKVNAAGTGLVYCGYIGGNSNDSALFNNIAIDGAGNAYVSGTTFSTEATFPDGDGFGAVPGADLTNNGSGDAFVAKVSDSGATLIYASYLGGSSSDTGTGIAVDGTGRAYITGYTASSEATFPEVGGPDLTYNGSTDAFVARFNAAGTALDYCGYIGGNGGDQAYGIQVDGSGNAYLAGLTTSSTATFPDGDGFGGVPGADTTTNGVTDAFLVKVSSTGSALTYATFIGGNNVDVATGVAVDSGGNAYVHGYTFSTQTTFPDGDGFNAVPGFDQTQNGGGDAFVVKLDSAGTSFAYATFLGGSGFDYSISQGAGGIAVDATGNVYLAGATSSDQTTFPVTGGPDLTFNLGLNDGFVAKLNAGGLTLGYCGYIGGKGPGDDFGSSIAVDSGGNAYITGTVTSLPADFPLVVGPDLTANGNTDAFVTKVNPAGTGLVYSGYIGGSDSDYGLDIAVDGTGNAYVTGGVGSTESAGFPVSVGPDLTHNGGGPDAFIARVNAAGSSLDYCGYIGGSGSDNGRSVAVDGAGNVYVAGDTPSTQTTFPDGDGFGSVPGADVIHNGNFDAFIVKVAPGGASLVYASYIGGISNDIGYGVDFDGSGNAYVTGSVASTEATFPDGDGFGPILGIDATYNGNTDGFLVKLNPAGTAFSYATYIGGSSNDFSFALDVDSSGAAYIAGQTLSTQTTFPDGDGFGPVIGYDTTHNGSNEAFVVKINAAGTAYDYATYFGGTSIEFAYSIAVDATGRAYFAGFTGSVNMPTLDGPDLSRNGLNDAFVARLNAAGSALSYAGYIGGVGTDQANGIAIDVSGAAYVVGVTDSDQASFPVTAGPSLTKSIGADAFVAKISDSNCNFSIAPTSQNFSGNGGSNTVNVTADAGCSWTATTTNVPWIVITSGSGSGTGNGVVSYTVLANNTVSSRSTGIIIAGRTFTVTQDATSGCVFAIDPTIASFDAAGGNGTINVSAAPGCFWAASTTDTWITINSGAAGSGNGTVSYTLAANTSATPRSGFFSTVAGLPAAVWQSGTNPSATITVNSAADTVAPDGACTLREAIMNANGNDQSGSIDCTAGSGRDIIAFNIPGAGPHTITPTSALPTITDQAILDGTTQPGASCTTQGGLKIELNGASTAGAVGVNISAGNSVVRGLVINRFGSDGIRLTTNFGDVVTCNYVGTDVTGQVDLGNALSGIQVQTAYVVIGGATPGAGNLVSGNGLDGVNTFTNGAVEILGNLIGTNVTGAGPIPNDGSGVFISRSIFNIIGGATAAARNVISGNGTQGISIFAPDPSSTSNSNVIIGNYIGTDFSGTIPLGNGGYGISLYSFNSNNNFIGGTIAGMRNVISGNAGGISIGGQPTIVTTGNQVLGNYIGTNSAGTSGIANTLDGVLIQTNTTNTIIGGTAAGTANRIAFNGRAGVALTQTGALPIIGNRILGNEIFSNGALGIDHSPTAAPDGVTANDAGDGDAGPNNLQNFPVLASAGSNGVSTTIAGALNSAASATFTIQFFGDTACDVSGNGEGRTYLGQTTVTTDGSGDATINVVLPIGMLSGSVITATATDSSNNTSEFSLCQAVVNTCPSITVDPMNATLPNATAGLSYSQTFTASGGAGAYSFSVTAGSLPGNMMLTAGGVLTGAATTFGDFTFTVTATDENLCPGSRQYMLHVYPPCIPITVGPATAANGFVGTPYSQTFTQMGGNLPIAWSSTGALPPGLMLDAGTGALTGTPATIGTFSFTVTATDSHQCTGSKAYTVMISGAGLMFYPLPVPVRLLDTRVNFQACITPNAPLVVGPDTLLIAANGCTGVPSSAVAVVGNATVVNSQSGGGWITLYPSNAARPNASNLNFTANHIVPNSFTVGLGGDGGFKIFTAAATNFIVDITGYFAPPGAGGLYYHPLAVPVRLLDTRVNFQACNTPNAPLAVGPDTLQIATIGCTGVPATAKAIVGNATVVNSQSAGGWITLYPSNAALPNASNLNFTSNHIVPNAFTVGLGLDGGFKIFTAGATNFIVDVTGYYSAEAVDANGPGLLYTPLASPVRLLDTRVNFQACITPNAPLAVGPDTLLITTIGCTGVPATAKAVVGNATVVNFQSSGGWITLYPSNAALPNASNLNFTANHIVPNAFTVGLGLDGGFKIFIAAATNFIVDVAGYFEP